MKTVIRDKERLQYLLRLERGEEFVGALTDFCKEKNITAAALQAIGSTTEVTLAWYDAQAKDYQTKTYTEELEIISILGNVAVKDGAPFVHAHGSFSNRHMQMVAGHVKRLAVAVTCEVSLRLLEGEARRSYDEETGLHLLE